MDSKVRDEDGITVVNHAKVQTTYSDYILAEEEYARKKALAAALKASGGAAQPTVRSTTASAAARMDRAENIRQLKKLLANPEISQEDRNTMERRLHEEEMAAAFTR
jgi:hypothetical protein